MIQVANENVREVTDAVSADLGPSETKVDIVVDTLKYDASVFALGALGHDGVPVREHAWWAACSRWRRRCWPWSCAASVAAEVKAEAKEHAPAAVDRVAALVAPKLDEVIDGFGARLLGVRGPGGRRR